MNHPFLMLLRREFWEHRSLWIAPLVWVGVIVIMFTWGTIQITFDNDIGPMADAQSIEELHALGEGHREGLRQALGVEDERRQTVYAVLYLAIGALLATFACIVVFFYLIDCLFTERRDRSILFWKSLPVSDTQVVLSKFATAMVIVPAGVLVLSAVTQLLLLAIWNLRFNGTVIGMLMPDLDLGSWARAQVIEAGMMLGGLMWYAPIAAYFLLLSVWVKRFVFLWAVIPLAAAPLLEAVFLRSTHVAEFLGDRFVGYVKLLNLDEQAMGDTAVAPGVHMPRVQSLYDAFEFSGIFTSAETWLGLAAAAALLYLTIRIRRHRDES